MPFINAAIRRFAALGIGIAACLGLGACTTLQAYRTDVPALGQAQRCAADCVAQATELTALYALHVVEFDDEGWPFELESAPRPTTTSSAPRGGTSKVAEPHLLEHPRNQIDSAVEQIKAQLAGTGNCVRLFVYVHGWRHDARTSDSNVRNFRRFLAQVGERSKAAAASGLDACEDPALADVSDSRKPRAARAAPAPRPAAQVQTVGIYVGWRGLSVVDAVPLVYASFWDRKNTADRVSQGSVRELFGRLSALASYAPAANKPQATPSRTDAQLRTYVIGHSFGASVVYRALSQSLIDSFSEDLDSDSASGAELASVARFVDMVVLVNPAIEAARFDPLFRAAGKLGAYCERRRPAAQRCDQPHYQAPVLAIFTSEGDVATKRAFPIGAALNTAFETTTSPAQREAIVQTIGWADAYQTHTLAPAAACDAANAHPFDPFSDPLRYRPPGWTWCFTTGSGAMALTHLGRPAPAPPGERRVYNGPLWNVRVSSAIVADHNDTWNERFRDLLLHLFTDERRHRELR